MKKEISINPSEVKKDLGVMYDFNTLKFAFCTSPNRKGQVKVATYFDLCRETIASVLRNQLETKMSGHSDSKVTNKIDLRKTRLILFTKAPNKSKQTKAKNFAKEADKEIKVSLKLVNHYEKRLDWLRTKMTKLDNNGLFKNALGDDINDIVNMYMVVGTNKWLKSPQVLSLYMLLLRLGSRSFKGRFRTHEGFLRELESFINGCKGDYYKQKDIGHVRATYDKWDVLLDNYDKLFKHKSINRFYCQKYLINGSTGFNEGITSLCSGYSRDLKLSNEFIELCKLKGITIKYKVKIAKNAER